jgi:hypothetical protein
MSQLPRPLSEPVSVRARGHHLGDVRFWVLSDSEVAGARSGALREARAAAHSGSPAFGDIYARQIESRVVALATRGVEDVQVASFRDALQIRDHLTEDEVSEIFAAYVRFRAGIGPILAMTTPPEMDVCIDRLGEGLKQSSLDALRWGSAERLADVPGIDASCGFLDCHFLCWCAARRVLYPS